MPLATNPLKTIRVVLSDDKGLEPEPAFIYRYLTYAEWKEIDSFNESLQTKDKKKFAKIFGKAGDKIFDMLRHKLISWENMAIDYDPAKLEELLTLQEAFELLALKSKQLPTVKDKKKSESP